jgi:hypothetical protein
MSDKNNEPKDSLDKISIGVSSLSTFVLMIIAILNGFIGYQTSQLQQKTENIENQLEGFKTNIQTAELIQKLIGDLQSPKLKKDIALIALNRTIADNDESSKQMIAEIATQIYRSRFKELMSKPSNTDQEFIGQTPEFQDTFTALMIIGERDPNQANGIIKELRKLQEGYKKNNDPREKIVEQITKNFDFGVVIYYNENEEEVSKFKQYLGKNYTIDLHPIKKEDVQNTYSLKNDQPISRIKYFHAGDRERAKNLEELTQSYVNNNKNINLPKDLLESDLLELVDWNAPNGRIEIWVYFPPTPSTPSTP